MKADELWRLMKGDGMKGADNCIAELRGLMKGEGLK
jgi:hypothetical protein